MKKKMNIALYIFSVIAILSGNTKENENAFDVMLQPYRNILQHTDAFPESQKDSIVKWIRRDIVIRATDRYNDSIIQFVKH